MIWWIALAAGVVSLLVLTGLGIAHLLREPERPNHWATWTPQRCTREPDPTVRMLTPVRPRPWDWEKDGAD